MLKRHLPNRETDSLAKLAHMMWAITARQKQEPARESLTAFIWFPPQGGTPDRGPLKFWFSSGTE